MQTFQTIFRKLFLHSNLFNICLIIIFAISYFVLVYNKYFQYEYFYIDNAYFASAIHALSRGEIPIVWHQWWGEMNIFADHFHPILFFVAFFVKIFPSSFTIFALIPIAIVMTSIYFLAISNLLKIKPLVTSALLIAYFTSLPLQNATLNGFHENVFVGVFLMSSFWALISRKNFVFFCSMILLLSTKETSFALALWLIVYALSQNLLTKKQFMFYIAICLTWFFASVKLLIPYLSGGAYRYGSLPGFATLAEHFQFLLTPLQKWYTLIVSVGAFLFLPIFDIFALLLITYEFFSRFYFTTPGNVQDTLYYHYGYQSVPLILLASVLVIKKYHFFFQKFSRQVIFLLLVVFVNLIANFKALPQRGALYNTIIPAFYHNTSQNAFLGNFIAKVPTTQGVINTQNHLATALTNKSHHIRFLTHNLESQPRCSLKNQNEAKFIVYDLREGQNPNNFFNSNEEKSKIMIEGLLKHQFYRIYFQEASLFILQKNESNASKETL